MSKTNQPVTAVTKSTKKTSSKKVSTFNMNGVNINNAKVNIDNVHCAVVYDRANPSNALVYSVDLNSRQTKDKVRSMFAKTNKTQVNKVNACRLWHYVAKINNSITVE